MDHEMYRFRGSLLVHRRKFDTPPLSYESKRRETSFLVDYIGSHPICEADGGRLLKLKSDVTDYALEEIVIKTFDNKSMVSIIHYHMITHVMASSIVSAMIFRPHMSNQKYK